MPVAPRTLIARIASDEWQMPLALACGCALLIGFSLSTLVDESMGRWSEVFHSIGDGLVWVSLALGAVHGLKAAWESLAEGKPNIDVLMVVGAGLAAAIGHPGEGALLLFMFTLAGALEHRALAKARSAVERLSKLMPNEAMKRENGSWVPVEPESLRAGDVVLVRAGETMPADGVVAKGHSTVDQSTLTGESLPRPVDEGDEVFAGTLNENGALEVRVTRPVQESSLKRILDLVIEAQEQRQPMQRLIDSFSTPYTIGVFLVAIATLAFFRFYGPGGEPMTLADAAYRAITLLIVASPCALVIATPTATLCGLNRAARAGLLVKGGDALERLSRVDVVVMDKTGTLTTGQVEVVGVDPPEAGADLDLLAAALGVEERSTHPIAQAIVRYARAQGARASAVEDFQMVPGSGIEAMCDGEPLVVGTIEYVAPRAPERLRAELEAAVARVREEGGITAAMAWGDRAAVFALADTPRAGAAEIVQRLRDAGVERIVMLTGDHKVIAERTAQALGITEVHANLLPEQKVERIRALRAEHGRRGRLAVVGDGVNDAPALATADVGLAMGGIGADAALETADVVILNDDITIVPWAFTLARAVRRVMIINLAFALTVILGLAIGALVGLIPMGVGVIGHEGSTLLVVANSLVILLYSAHEPAKTAGARADRPGRADAGRSVEAESVA
jgi:Cd2+/Zn2+-exporting ATPase